MEKKLNEIARKHLKKEYHELTVHEQRVVAKVAQKESISRNINNDLAQGLTFGQRMADKVASFGGTWTFIAIFGLVLAAWVILNSVVLIQYKKDFDPYPYILLNLFLSMLASIQAPVIMMSQNRQAVRDRLDAAHDYEVNLKAEMEILELHAKMDELLARRWQELLALQQEQIEMLKKVVGSQSNLPVQPSQ